MRSVGRPKGHRQLGQADQRSSRADTSRIYGYAQQSINNLYFGLVNMWGDASAEEQNEIGEATAFDPKDGKTAMTPLGLCRFAQALIRGSRTEASVESALAVNGIDCNLQ